jgi:hypothetical protein
MLRSWNARGLVMIASCVFVNAAWAAAQSVSPAQQSADKLFADSKWQQAAQVYVEITANEPRMVRRGNNWASVTFNCSTLMTPLPLSSMLSN